MKFTQLRWGRVLVGGFLAEVLVFAIVFPVLYLFGQRAFLAPIHRVFASLLQCCRVEPISFPSLYNTGQL